MQKALSTHLFVNQRLTVSLLEQIEKSGVELLEIFCARQHFDYHDRNQVQEIAAWFRNSQLRLHSIHAPMYRDTAWGRSGPQSIVSIAEPEKIRRIKGHAQGGTIGRCDRPAERPPQVEIFLNTYLSTDRQLLPTSCCYTTRNRRAWGVDHD